MFLILVFGAWLGWQVKKAREQREADAAVRRHGGWVHYDWEFVNGKRTRGRQPPAPRWLRGVLGDEYFQEVRHVSLVYDDSTGRRYDNHNQSPCDDVLALLSNQYGLRSLMMRGTQATDAGLRHLRGLTGLEDLYVWDATLISDDGVGGLAGLFRLKNLHLDSSKVTDRGFRSLSRLTRLEHLALEAHQFTDGGLAAVAGMKDLKWLCVSGSKQARSGITDRWMALVRGLTGLENLDLEYSGVTDRGLVDLKGLQNLRVLGLGGCDVTDDGLANLAGLSRLKWLFLNETQVTDRGLEHLRGLSNLQLVLVNGTRVTEQGKRQFKASMPRLKGM
jgi:hypothetical protein